MLNKKLPACFLTKRKRKERGPESVDNYIAISEETGRPAQNYDLIVKLMGDALNQALPFRWFPIKDREYFSSTLPAAFALFS
ncbi:MAG: hypothetical protein D3916_05930 [Candidatus Electrothrix sp. MAN1_4]|nr:hypothetical protein [Candidatus Electrothrix sp. MAN1_4]